MEGFANAAASAALYTVKPSFNLEKEEQLCELLVTSFIAPGTTTPKYLEQLKQVSLGERQHISIALADALQHPDLGASFCARVTRHARTYQELFYRVLDRHCPERVVKDVQSVFMIQRMNKEKTEQNEGDEVMKVANEEQEKSNPFPAALMRYYDLSFELLPCKARAVRELHAHDLGALVQIRGIITRVSQVHPQCQVFVYTCDQCGHELYQEVTSPTFQPLPECISSVCRQNASRGKVTAQTRASKFIQWQEARLQEIADQVPMGHTPRSMTIQFMGSQCRRANAGDAVLLSGVYLPRAYEGFLAMKSGGLLTEPFMDCHQVQLLKGVTIEESIPMAVLEELSQDTAIYDKLASSIAPELYGMEDVKKCLLLQMVSLESNSKDESLSSESLRIRNHLHLCLMGDPGVAKSQLLQYISRITPRGVYTTGKGSSGVGLTAAVLKDAITGSMVLEAGALVLADHGVCCIDEFDKMDETDRTGIHEVMEQQTISIAKAGITTTLNARAAILAAANPAYGRYNRQRSLQENIQLPAALLSRFDILFLLLDVPEEMHDLRLAEHVTSLHCPDKSNEKSASDKNKNIIPTSPFKAYLSHCQSYQPRLSPDLQEYLAGIYVALRMASNEELVTPRTLLSILRLARAMAKIHWRELIIQSDIDEALRLLDSARNSLNSHVSVKGDKAEQRGDPITRIYALIRDMSHENDATLDVYQSSMSKIRDRVLSQGYTEQQLQECLQEFEQAGLWRVVQQGKMLQLFH